MFKPNYGAPRIDTIYIQNTSFFYDVELKEPCMQTTS